MATPQESRDTVVLLHGIGHRSWNMAGAEWAMQRAGYRTVNITYPSLRRDIPALAAFVNERLEQENIWNGTTGRVHFVTHSMGGIVTRRCLHDFRAHIPAEKMGRLVMIAPPNGGSEVADFLKDFPPYRWLFGPAGQQLTTAARTADDTSPWYESGIIAGTTGWPYIIAHHIIPGPHDGRVAVEKTRMQGMKDHIAIPATHSLISWNPRVHRQAVYFLKNGTFETGI